MKKLVSICLLLFIVVIGNAQVNDKPKLNELNQDQLNLAFKRAKNTATTGIILTSVGTVVASIGMVMAINEGVKWVAGENSDENTVTAGTSAMIVGGITALIGIPVWIVGASKKKNIQLELAKFNTPGSASIYGIGLKIRF